MFRVFATHVEKENIRRKTPVPLLLSRWRDHWIASHRTLFTLSSSMSAGSCKEQKFHFEFSSSSHQRSTMAHLSDFRWFIANPWTGSLLFTTRISSMAEARRLQRTKTLYNVNTSRFMLTRAIGRKTMAWTGPAPNTHASKRFEDKNSAESGSVV